MQNSKPIQFLLHQLATNERDRENLNLILPAKLRCHLSMDDGSLEFGSAYNSSQPFEDLEEIYQEKIILTCLSRVNNEAALRVFDKNDKSIIEKERLQKEIAEEMSDMQNMSDYSWRIVRMYKEQFESIKILTDLLYKAFNYPLRNGKPLDEAIQALHDKMLELVPEYQEFLKNI